MEIKISPFFAKFMSELRLIKYHQKAQTITSRNDELPAQKKLIETPKIPIQNKNLFQEILNEVIVNIKNTDNNDEIVAKLISMMQEQERIKIITKLVGNTKLLENFKEH